MQLIPHGPAHSRLRVLCAPFVLLYHVYLNSLLYMNPGSLSGTVASY